MAPPAASADEQSARIAERLLLGWRLLAEYCQRDGCLAPLMRSRDGRLYCAAHDAYVGGAEPPPAPSPAKAAPQPTPVAPRREPPPSPGPLTPRASPAPSPAKAPPKTPQPDAAAAAAAERAKSDEQAGRIADKLLLGWTLLAEYCPVEGCLAPLMRAKDGKKYCPAHDMWVLTQQQARESGPGAGASPHEAGGAPSTSASPAKPPARSPARATERPPPLAVRRAAPAASDAVTRALDALLVRMDASVGLVESAGDVASARDAVALVRECAEAHAAVRAAFER